MPAGRRTSPTARSPGAARADRHRRAAEWIASLTPDRAEDRAELLAHHWSRALEFARAARQDDTVLARRAGQALRDAGAAAAHLEPALVFYCSVGVRLDTFEAEALLPPSA